MSIESTKSISKACKRMLVTRQEGDKHKRKGTKLLLYKSSGLCYSYCKVAVIKTMWYTEKFLEEY